VFPLGRQAHVNTLRRVFACVYPSHTKK